MTKRVARGRRGWGGGEGRGGKGGSHDKSAVVTKCREKKQFDRCLSKKMT